MSIIDVEQILQGLNGFQRDAVDHVIDRLYRTPGSSGRFLVADETGLGKSIIARGVIASTIAECSPCRRTPMISPSSRHSIRQV